ncbi:MAG: type II toxin-antitoxin system VapC family toxin [Armatimonadetes bacterium]|nr:type II toxin-antitoxin system VapC family toxin [Armatimonadota bacterium]PIU63996.1 MAG: hypothetical protein COS85_14240 [Armatimonadetes bacterium CG07_land_8_20_14_0_80_59_28]PIX42985.1 MAG: hypothetical protein COZ56_08145 [Armatimonadetes bacterium CG_4_8_14_3_um_filter_58_9]PIY49476.1 MAG: hypothetical protein COZ05_00300 [Armatimonadetes bacterium CG_4_10_14_3_um_filter_59_10]PJB65579.1 MAG: hypothetical protein CO095_13930 [Armatimonadetes bacterium CG_4_9_14_3_um_filter_58_7]
MSTRKPKAVVLDAWAVLAYREDEPGAEEIAELVIEAQNEGVPVMMTTVNVGEVWYILAREVSETEADKAVQELRHLGIQFIDPDWKLTRDAAALKAKHRMSFADCFAAALAKQHKAQLVTGDVEFKQVEGEVQMRWVT